MSVDRTEERQDFRQFFCYLEAKDSMLGLALRLHEKESDRVVEFAYPRPSDEHHVTDFLVKAFQNRENTPEVFSRTDMSNAIVVSGTVEHEEAAFVRLTYGADLILGYAPLHDVKVFDCYIEEYNNDGGVLCARLREKVTGRKVEFALDGVVGGKTHLIRFLSEGAKRRSMMPAVFDKSDMADKVRVMGDVLVDSPELLRLATNPRTRYYFA